MPCPQDRIFASHNLDNMRSSTVCNAASLLTCALAPNFAHAQFPPTPEGLTVVDSKFKEGVKISYKEVRILKLVECIPN